MADNVQWIRLIVGMFDGNSFKKIKRAKIGGVSYRDKLTAIWFELLDLAGKSNANGYLIDNNEIPYQSFEDIATMLDREEKEIELCMQFFINEKMVEIVDDVYCLTNFAQYQNQDGLAQIREKNRLRQIKCREKKKQALLGCSNNGMSRDCHVTSNVTSHESHAIEIDKDIEIDNNIHTPHVRACEGDQGQFEENLNAFCQRWNVKIDNYSPLMAELDFDKLNTAFSESSKFLQVAPIARMITWIIKNASSIYAGKYKDKPETTARKSVKQSEHERGTDILKKLFEEENRNDNS